MLAVAAVIASVVPARRSMAVDPALALRAELSGFSALCNRVPSASLCVRLAGRGASMGTQVIQEPTDVRVEQVWRVTVLVPYDLRDAEANEAEHVTEGAHELILASQKGRQDYQLVVAVDLRLKRAVLIEPKEVLPRHGVLDLLELLTSKCCVGCEPFEVIAHGRWRHLVSHFPHEW